MLLTALMFSVLVSDKEPALTFSRCSVREDLCVGSRFGMECDLTNVSDRTVAAIRFRVLVSAQIKQETYLARTVVTEAYTDLDLSIRANNTRSQILVVEGPGENADMESLQVIIQDLEALDRMRRVVLPVQDTGQSGR